MKMRYSIFVLLVVLLGGMLFKAESVVTQTAAPNTNFETGDNFYYLTAETGNNDFLNKVVLANDTNPSQLYQYQENYEEEVENTQGDLDLFIIKPSSNLPPFTSPSGDFDHLSVVDWSKITVNPSTKTGYSNFFDAGGGGFWSNSTSPIEDTSGRYYSNLDNNGLDNRAIQLVSNSTYLMQTPEMINNSISLEVIQKFGQQFDFGYFDSNLPLISREVTEVIGRSYFINNINMNLNTRLVNSTFGTTFLDTFLTTIPFGNPNDPNAWIEVNATIEISANYLYEYYFDSITGIILEVREVSNFSFDLNYLNSSFINLGPGPATYLVNLTFLMNEDRSYFQTVNEASSFYGNARPVSSGSNRIEEGHLLTYSSESNNDYSFDMNMIGGDPLTTGFENHDSIWTYNNENGLVNFDVYRHFPGGANVVRFSEGTSNGEFSTTSWGINQNNNYNYANTSILGPTDYLEFDYLSFQSTANEDIAHSFDDVIYFKDDFLYEEGDSWRIVYPKSVPKSGLVNVTSWHMDLEPGEFININGYDHTWFDIQMYGQRYESAFNMAVEIPVLRDEYGETWMTIQLVGLAIGEQKFFYDQNTGVLLAIEQTMNVVLNLNGNALVDYTIQVEGQPPNTILINVDLQTTINIDENFFMVLTQYPVEYLSPELVDPVDHSTNIPSDTGNSTTSTTTTYTTTTPSTTTSTSTTSGTTTPSTTISSSTSSSSNPQSTTSSSTTNISESANLPLPVQIAPVLSGFSIIVIYLRKRSFKTINN